MTVPEAMREPALRRFLLRRLRLPVAGGRLSIVAPRSMRDLLDAEGIARFERSGQLPYWADVWPASVGVARHLLRGPSLLGKSVLDLGCGVGVAGVGAARHGAAVCFADQDTDALAFAAFNARHNAARAVRTVRVDWHRETVEGRFDVVLLADVAYTRKHHAPLLRHLFACLEPRGHALLADPYREDADAFVRLLREHFAVTIDATETSFEERRVPLRLVTIQRAPA
jgi:predicted nicotinamide N-methyase